jgi:hypothetical protein
MTRSGIAISWTVTVLVGSLRVVVPESGTGSDVLSEDLMTRKVT